MKVLKTLNRFYTSDIDHSVSFYENLLDIKCTLRVNYSQAHLKLAMVGDILILAGSDEALKPFLATKATFLVDSIREFRKFLIDNGAVIIRDITTVPTGENMTLKHSDGIIVEYVEFKK